MQVVGHLVGIDPNQGRLDRVDRQVEVRGGYRSELFRERLPEMRLEKAPERAAARDLVLPQPALRFVHRHAHGLAERRSLIFQSRALLVQAVAGLVNRTEQRIERMVLVEPRRHADVRAAALAEGMQRHVDPPAPVVEPQAFGHAPQEAALLLDRETAENVRPRLHRRRHDLAHERDEALPQPGEQALDRRGGHSRIMLVDHVIVGRGAVAEIGRLLPGQVEVLLEKGRETREVRLRPALRPGVEGPAGMRRLLAHEFRRQLGHPVVVPPGLSHDHLFVGGELGPPAFQISQPFADPRIAGGGMLEFGHQGQLFGAQVGAVGRQVDLLIPAEQAVDGMEDVGAFEPGHEFGVGGFVRHGPIEPTAGSFASVFWAPIGLGVLQAAHDRERPPFPAAHRVSSNSRTHSAPRLPRTNDRPHGRAGYP